MATLSTAILVLLMAGIVAVLVLALSRRDVAAGVNALGMLVATAIPIAVEGLFPLLGQEVTVGQALPLWIAAAGFVHSVGMLGPYDTHWWWDLLTHTLSAALVAALIIAGFLVVAQHSNILTRSSAALGLLTVGMTFLAGVFWELLELVARDVGHRFDIEPVLVHYGWRDTVVDLLVDVGAASGVVLLEIHVFVPIAAQAPGLTTWLMVGSAGVLGIGTVVLALIVGWTHADVLSIPE